MDTELSVRWTADSTASRDAATPQGDPASTGAAGWQELRADKPRSGGLTMVMDKGVGLAQTLDWLECASKYVDYVKLGFGTALLYPPDVLRRKVRAIVDADVAVLPGGTLLEAALVAGDLEGFFEFARSVSFTHVEVSDGTVTLSRNRRRELIRQARNRGFRVLTEVGKKDPSRPLDANFAIEQVALDLEVGAEKVVMEARDSGRGSGVFDEDGALRGELFEQLLTGLPDPGSIIWEAPDPSQQLGLLLRLGPDANFGNVQVQDVFTLEAMRRGLRSDTLRVRTGS